MWGQVNAYWVFVLLYRIIPTRMGTSTIRKFCAVVKQDHPHAYGDKPFILIVSPTLTGSSPRVWGQATKIVELFDRERIIPTRMGTRKARLKMANLFKDHPHAYGDKYSR